MLDKLPEGKVLCLGDGEGRNFVWLAEQGVDVTAVYLSKKVLVGLNYNHIRHEQKYG
jgi:hypothetical protein